MPESFIWRQLAELNFQEPFPIIRSTIITTILQGIQICFFQYPFANRFFDKHDNVVEEVKRVDIMRQSPAGANTTPIAEALWSLVLSQFKWQKMVEERKLEGGSAHFEKAIYETIQDE